MPVPVILDCSSSPYSRLKPVPIDAVSFQHGFWADRLQSIKQITIPTQFDLLEETGRLDNFRRIYSKTDLPFRGYVFNDSDVYKWLEGACWSMASGLDGQLLGQINHVIEIITTAQDRDGYLNTFFVGDKSGDRWTNLRDKHELYCAGHLIQAAIAHYRLTTQDKLLMVAVNLADHICRRFLDTDLPATPGHPQIEMALVELYRTVKDIRYLRMAQSFLDQRGSGVIDGKTYHLDHVPFREMKQLKGHAVRATYLCCGATDIYLETGENLLLDTLAYLWDRMVSSQMYVSGGIGSRHEGESFGNDYELPNERAYAETCAAIGSMMWNWRMLHIDADVKFADLVEWTLYNAILPGIGLNGQEYHYVNPLAVYGEHLRQPWFECACCPTNLLRLISSIGGYFYSHSENNIWIHQYASNISVINMDDGLEIKLSVETDYPWNGFVEIKLLSMIRSNAYYEVSHAVSTPICFGVNLRIPAWVQGNIPVFINDEIWHQQGTPGSYLKVVRNWVIGDSIKLEIPLPLRFLSCHPFVHENIDRVAVTRGPLLYCIEAVDNKKVDPRQVSIAPDASHTIHPMKVLSKDVVGIGMKAMMNSIADDWGSHLYRETRALVSFQMVKEQEISMIPYFAWGNRAHGWMQVWLSC